MNRILLPLLLAALPLIAPSSALAQRDMSQLPNYQSFRGAWGGLHESASSESTGQAAYRFTGMNNRFGAAAGPNGAAVGHENISGSRRGAAGVYGAGVAFGGSNAHTGGQGAGVATVWGGVGGRNTGNGNQVRWGYLPGVGAGAIVTRPDGTQTIATYDAQTGQLVVQ
jgi:hypothetical protein